MSARYLKRRSAPTLEKKSLGNGDGAQGLGRAALAGGLATLDLAVMHEQAPACLAASYDFASTHNGALKQAGYFLPRRSSHWKRPSAPRGQTNRHLRSSTRDILRLHTAALAKGNRRLQREVARREAGESTIRKRQGAV